MPTDQFAVVVAEALKTLPPRVRDRMKDVSVVVRNKPTQKELKEAGVPKGDTLLGLFVGTSLADKSVFDAPRDVDRIILYRKPLEEMCATRAKLVKEIRKTVIHEVGHFLGMEEEELERLGYE
jgi:predicted Zn-dependent protease with MMP-like domain